MALAFVSRTSQVSGSEFGAMILTLTNGPREQMIARQFEAGNVPDFMRTPISIEMHANGHTAVVRVLPDYLCVGTNEDFLRVPMNPMTAQRIADVCGAVLPTRRLVDAIWRYASVKLNPEKISPSRSMLSTQCFIDHNAMIERARQSHLLGALVAGVKKDVVLSKQLALRPDRVAIYGWHDRSGAPLQPLNVISHSNVYADYSHGVRLIDEMILVDGEREMRFGEVLRARALAALVTDEGPNDVTRQPKT